MGELKIKLPNKTKEELEKVAENCGISVEKLTQTIIEGFIEGDGRVYSASWRERPGIRLIHDWPRFSCKVFRIKKEEVE